MAANSAGKANAGDAPEHKRTLNLALQGGGAHGAFTWGVVDRLLEDGRFDLEGISGTSAGAMNAVCMADGFQSGGPDGARDRLKEFWAAVGESSRYSPIRRTPMDAWFGRWSLEDSPGVAIYNFFAGMFSPYNFNPLDFNPLRDIVDEQVNFENVRDCKFLKVFIAATNVWNGKVRVFNNEEITRDAVMASSCLPQVFKAVEIDGVLYWDGGYMGNPVLFPFFYNTNTEDILLVQINPIERLSTPRTAREITERINEITFNASLIRELRAIEFVSRMVDDGYLPADKYRKIRMHRIETPPEVIELSASSKLNTQPEFLDYLRDIGRKSADKWLASESANVGKRSGIDLKSEISYGLSGTIPELAGAEAAATKKG